MKMNEETTVTFVIGSCNDEEKYTCTFKEVEMYIDGKLYLINLECEFRYDETTSEYSITGQIAVDDGNEGWLDFETEDITDAFKKFLGTWIAWNFKSDEVVMIDDVEEYSLTEDSLSIYRKSESYKAVFGRKRA